MKNYILLLFFLCSSIGYAQLRMDILDLKIYQLDNNNEYPIVGHLGDTLSLKITQEHNQDSPYIEADIRIKNISDSNVNIYPDSKLFITYKYDKRKRDKNMYYIIQEKDNNLHENYILKPNQEINLSVYDYIVERGSSLDLDFKLMKDYKKALIKILPTLKFHFANKNGIEVIHNEIDNVEVQEKKLIPEDAIPSGYILIPNE